MAKPDFRIPKQDRAPPGGFPQVKYLRRTTPRIPGAALWTGVLACIFGGLAVLQKSQGERK